MIKAVIHAEAVDDGYTGMGTTEVLTPPWPVWLPHCDADPIQ